MMNQKDIELFLLYILKSCSKALLSRKLTLPRQTLKWDSNETMVGWSMRTTRVNVVPVMTNFDDAVT
jgi:hypothetical protein